MCRLGRAQRLCRTIAFDCVLSFWSVLEIWFWSKINFWWFWVLSSESAGSHQLSFPLATWDIGLCRFSCWRSEKFETAKLCSFRNTGWCFRNPARTAEVGSLSYRILLITVLPVFVQVSTSQLVKARFLNHQHGHIINDEVNSLVYGAVESWSAMEQPAGPIELRGPRTLSGFSRVVVPTVNQNHPILTVLSWIESWDGFAIFHKIGEKWPPRHRAAWVEHFIWWSNFVLFSDVFSEWLLWSCVKLCPFVEVMHGNAKCGRQRNIPNG